MDQKKLEKLQILAERIDFNDERLTEYYSSREKQLDNVRNYAGYATLLRAPQSTNLDNLDIALVGVPFDFGVTNRPGARFGPQQIRELSAMTYGPIHHASGIIPEQLCRFADYGDVSLKNTYHLDQGIEEIEAYYQKIAAAGVIPITAGGDHSITYPILKAIGRDGPLGLIHIDAHCDTGGPFNGSKFHHGGPFRNAALAGVLDPERTIQIGIRGHAEPHWDFSYNSGMRVVHVEEFYAMGLEKVIEEARRIVGDGPTYISFDVDGIDPAFTPGTGTPEVGGLTPLDVQQLIRGMRGLNLVGADAVEVAPPYDPTGNTALVAATMMWEMLCVIADSFAARKSTS
ncbi:MAG: agmatinase [Gammaproteobacteria bacterium]|nr:agmatinase [Gammaproteobacteria bacterium]